MLAILKRKSSSFENMFLLFLSAVLPWFFPVIHQSAEYHNFADSRMLLGIPNFMNVFSNIGFLLSGILLLVVIFKNKDKISDSIIAGYITFAIGSVITAFGSSYYHLNPSDTSLAWDRLPMTVTFAGLLSLMAYQTTKDKLFTASMLSVSLVFGVSSIMYWTQTLSLTPYVFMQFGGLIWITFHMFRAKACSNLIDWPLLIIFYILAKIMESFDAQIFEIFGQLLSGHTLKHYFAAIGITLVVYKLSKTLSHD